MAREVKLSPPGDPFPAMEGHIGRAIRAIDRQFGDGVGRHLLPDEKMIVMNKVSSLDAMYEIIVDGQMLGRLRFEIPHQSYKFILSLEGGRLIGEVGRQKWVSIYDEVLKFLKDGANLLLPGVVGCDSGIQLDDEVWIVDSSGKVVGVGIAKMSGEDMAKSEKGHAVKIRDISDPMKPRYIKKPTTWDE
ncbi:MAG: PUA domain-containing protein, partial [Candidatus Thorarchaeota archaeon]